MAEIIENFVNKNGVINQKKLFTYLYGKPVNVRSKSGLSPSAQNPVMYDAGNDWEAVQEAVSIAMKHAFRTHRAFYYFALIQMSGGLRVSEVLHIHIYDVTATGLIKVKVLKGGNDKVINVHEAKDFLKQCVKNAYLPWQNWNRFYVYREYKRLGFPSIPTGQNKHAVTHLFRHLQAAELKKIKVDEKTLAGYLGHKSLKSQQSYGR